MGYILLTWLLGQQVHGAEIVDITNIGNIADVMDIANITDIANIANIAKEAGRRNMVEMGGYILGVTGVSRDRASGPFLVLPCSTLKLG